VERAKAVDNVTQTALVTQSVEYIKNTLDTTSKKVDDLASKFDSKIESDLRAAVSSAERMIKMEFKLNILWGVVIGAIALLLTTAWQVWIKGVFKL